VFGYPNSQRTGTMPRLEAHVKATIAGLAEHFAAPPNAVARVMRAALGDTNVNLSEEVLLTDEQADAILFVVASSCAACQRCHASFKPFDPPVHSCACGQHLGRCPKCRRFTSFRLVQSYVFARDDFACESCGEVVTTCKHGKARQCERWAPKVNGEWRDYCIVCETDPERLADHQRSMDAFNSGVQQGIQQHMANWSAQRANTQAAVSDMRAKIISDIINRKG
jgi:hypothetical protein